MGIRSFKDFILRSPAFLIFGLCGLASILVDTDHLISAIWFEEWNGRFLHPYIFIISFALLCSLISFVCGLLASSNSKLVNKILGERHDK